MRNLKKVIALVAVFAMLVSTVAFADTFSDVAASDNYAEAIETLSDLGIITGDDQDGDGTMDFRPADTITRAEVAAIISRIQGMNSVAQAATNFADVPSTHWASGYVNNAEGRGIINGYGDGNFGPEDNVKYEEAIKMLMVTLGYEPFAADNGGYPTGYIAAAQRYGVLDDVIGGGVGTEAPRGMIAQLVFNAIDTPLMDKSTYGANAEYVIYDGVNYNFDSLLLRDLGIIKVTGKVVANSYSEGNIDTAADATIEIDVDATTDNLNYVPGLFNKDGERTDKNLDIYQADIDADAFLGYAVVAYAAETTRSNKYNLVSIRGDYDEDDIASFTLDQFDDITVGENKTTLEYMKNDTDRNATKLSVENSADIYYNGSESDYALSDFFGSGKLIEADSVYSGKVTLIDSNDVSGYDVVVIEVGVSAVVKDVSATNGRVRFLNSVEVPYLATNAESKKVVVKTDNIKEIKFDEDATDVLIKLSKDGDAVDYTELKEWDVLAVVWNPAAEVYNVEVMGEANAVIGAVESMKGADADKEYKLSDGNWYKVVSGAYNAGSLQVGSSGKFYVDAYGKIVALDVSVEVPGVSGVASDNYAYILRAEVDPDMWGNDSIVLQVMDKAGNIYEGYLASTTKITQGIDYITVKPGETSWTVNTENADLKGLTTPKAVAEFLQNKLVTYASNSNDEVKEIVVATKDNGESGKLWAAGVASGEYDEDNMIIDGYEINDETYVFYIGGTKDNIKYDGNVIADKDSCSVGTGATFAETDYVEVHVFDLDASTDVAKVIVVMNQSGMISPLTNIAVIESIGTTSVDGYDVASVEYWMNGELKTATTDADGTDFDGVENAERGDVYKFALEGDVIVSAEKELTFARTGDKPFAEDATAVVKATVAGGNGVEKSDEAMFFGAVTDVTSGGSVQVTLLDADGNVVLDEEGKAVVKTIKETAETNAYLFDSQLKYSNALDLGSLLDADVVDDVYVEGPDPKYGDAIEVGKATITSFPAYGMLDYVFVRTYNRRVADVVVYKNYEFDYDVVDAK